jgi:hypothetical protein
MSAAAPLDAGDDDPAVAPRRAIHAGRHAGQDLTSAFRNLVAELKAVQRNLRRPERARGR